MHNSRKYAATASIVGLAMAGLMASPALASGGDGTPPTTTALVNEGELAITNLPSKADFAPSDVTGKAQDITADGLTFSVADLRGSGDGWNVTAKASTFAGTGFHGGTAHTPNTLLPGSLTMSPATTVDPEEGTESEPPEANGSDDYLIDDGDAVKIAAAAVDKGMGTYDFSGIILTLHLPADVYADAYSSTVTLTSVTAP